MNLDLRDERSDDAFVEGLTAYLDELYLGERPAAPTGEFAPFVVELRAESSWTAPPSGLRDSILDRVRELAAAAPVASDERHEVVPDEPRDVVPDVSPVPDVAPAAAPTDGRARGWRRWRSRMTDLRWAVPVAAVAAALFTAGVIATDRALQPGPTPRDTYTVAGTSLAPDASATVTVLESGSGFPIVFAANQLPAAAPGSYYAAWLRGDDGIVPLGTFHQRRTSKSIQLWSGVDPRDYPTFFITLQAEGEPPAPSNRIVLTGSLNR